jgi:hypothetical protein
MGTNEYRVKDVLLRNLLLAVLLLVPLFHAIILHRVRCELGAVLKDFLFDLELK